MVPPKNVSDLTLLYLLIELLNSRNVKTLSDVA